MKRILLSCIAALLSAAMLLSFAGCSAQSSGDFTDDAGGSVSLPASPRRVAVLFSSLAELWCLSDGELSVTVGETVERGIAPIGTPLVDGGAGKSIDLEALIASECDLVIGSADVPAHRAVAEALRAIGTPTLLLHLESFSDYLRILELFCRLNGSDAYGRYGTPLEVQVEAILANAKDARPKRVLFLRAGASASSLRAKSSRDHFAAAILTELGCENLADSAPILLDGLSIEAVLEGDPDLILVSTMGDEAAARANVERQLSDGAWQTLRAVREGQVYFLDKAYFQYKPNARWAEAYQILSELIHDAD